MRKKDNKHEQHDVEIEVAEVLMIMILNYENKIEIERVEHEKSNKVETS